MDKKQPKVAQKVFKAANSQSSSGSWSSAGSMTPPRCASTKENTKPKDFKLHTQERAVHRAMFNHVVAAKIYLHERQKRTEKKILKMIEEEEIRSLRKEMVFKAQLMPYFDKPFFPQRSSRALTVPRDGSRSNVSYGFQRFQQVKPIK